MKKNISIKCHEQKYISVNAVKKTRLNKTPWKKNIFMKMQ